MWTLSEILEVVFRLELVDVSGFDNWHKTQMFNRMVEVLGENKDAPNAEEEWEAFLTKEMESDFVFNGLFAKMLNTIPYQEYINLYEIKNTNH